MDGPGETVPQYQCCYNCVQAVLRKWPNLFSQRTFRLLTGINFVLAIFVTGAPFWTAELIEGSFTFMGLWSICNPKFCSKIKVSDDIQAALRILMVVVLAHCFLGVLCAWNLVARYTGNKTLENVISSVSNFIAGFAMLFGLLVLAITSEEVVFLNFYLGCILSLLSMLLGEHNLWGWAGERTLTDRPKATCVHSGAEIRAEQNHQCDEDLLLDLHKEKVKYGAGDTGLGGRPRGASGAILEPDWTMEFLNSDVTQVRANGDAHLKKCTTFLSGRVPT
ncbi:hypothetical protein lerEdw1_009891 [Lerista edwardsae]|nr:hypothetical protein lerEdw1_009891 [Lerista edwardsae]